MKHLNFTKSLLLLFAASLGLSSCKKDRGTIPAELRGIYVLNEGSFSIPENNSSITYHEIETNITVADYFKSQNGVDLGTNANDLQQYGDKMYCVVTGADATPNDSYVEVMNLSNGKSVKRIPFYNAGGDFSARFIRFYKDKAYVSSYDGYISKIDIASLTIESRLKVGGALEGLTIANGKLYVTNSNHVTYATSNNTSVSVVDLGTFTKKMDIPVSFNPTRIVGTANGDLYTLTMGSYASPYIAPAMDKLNSTSDVKVQSYDQNLMAIASNNNNVYVITGDYPTPLIKSLNTSSGALGADIITDGTVVASPNGISVNVQNNDICIADANNYVSSGKLLVFGSNGAKKMEFPTGVTPSMAVFNYSYN